MREYNLFVIKSEYNQIYKKDLPMVKDWNELYNKVKDMTSKKI